MCGILAFWNRDGAPIDRAALARAVATLRRRGPDDEGYLLVDTRTGHYVQCRGTGSDPRIDLPTLDSAGEHPWDLALGHRRLSIVDLSPAGHQPMSALDGALWIVFNGMIHNFLELRKELQGLGHSFRSRTDTEVILHAYAEWGTDCVARFNGMWAFVIWDGRTRQLFTSRDRLGIKPLLAATAGAVVAFASELKALRHVPNIPFELDPVAVHHYLSLMKVPAPFTIFRQARKILPGHSTVVGQSDSTDRAYWSLDPSPAPMTPENAVERIAELLTDSIRLRLIADVPMGSLLSGGVDSSIVTAMAAAGMPAGDLASFTLSFPGQPDVDESPWARQLATQLGVRHHEVEFSTGFLEDFPGLVSLFDEPFAVSSALGVYRLAEEASHHTKILLTGDGGDEIFAGYLHRHSEVDAQWDRIDRRPLSRFRGGRARAVADQVRWAEPSMADLLRIRIQSLMLSPQRARDRSFNARRAMFNEAEKRALYTPAWRDLSIRSADTLSWLGETLPPPGGDRLTRWQIHDVRTSLHDEMLTKVDRATMASGVEARPPLLDHRLVELAVNLPAALKLQDGRGKWILRQVGARYVPEGLFDRAKGGFTMPLSRWFKGEWREILGDALAPSALRRVGVLQPRAVQAVLAHHEAHPNFITAHMVYTLLCFQTWHDVFHRT